VKKEVKKIEKRSTSLVKSQDLYFRVYSYIKEGLNPSQIATKLNIPKTNLNWYISRLKRNGYIQKLGYGVWKTSTSLQFNTLKLRSTSLVRSHAFIFSLVIPNIPNWNNREIYLNKKRIIYKTFKNRFMQSFIFKNIRVQIGNKKIVVYFPKWKSYFVKSARTGYNYAIYDFLQIINGLENLFQVSFKIKRNYKFKVGRQHQAIINSELAKMYNKDKKKLHIRNKQGILWLLIDNSSPDGINLNEEECVYSKKAVEHSEFLQRFYNELEQTRLTPKVTLDMINKVTANQVIFDNNMKSHIKAIQELAKGIKIMNKKLDKL